MNQNEEILDFLCICLKVGLQGQTPPNLRAVSFAEDGNKLFIRAHFDSAPSEDEADEISCVETEVYASFPDDTVIETDVEVEEVGTPLHFLAGGIAYLREGEPGTVCPGKPAAWIEAERRRQGEQPAPGEAGSKQRFDDDKIIGIFKNEGGDQVPTTRGIIHYGKEGAHIVPAAPRGYKMDANDKAAKKEDLVRELCWNAKRALQGETPASLRAYSFAMDREAKEIRLRAHFDSAPSEDEAESMSCVETEIAATFLDRFETETDIEVAPAGTPLALLADGVAYLRDGEAGTVCGCSYDPANS